MVNLLRRLIAAVLRSLPSPIPQLPYSWRQARLRQKIRQETQSIEENESSWRLDSKVFGIGLSKTGTTSLSAALERLGYDSVSWMKGPYMLGKYKILTWPDLIRADAATDTSCAARFEVLYHTFPNSKFIYTVRDMDKWKASMINQFGMKRPGKALLQPKDKHRNPAHWTWIHQNLYAQHDSWEEAYHAHDARVRNFFEGKPDDQFLEMDIVNGDGYKTLCRFLGHEVPDGPFPHRNRSNHE